MTILAKVAEVLTRRDKLDKSAILSTKVWPPTRTLESTLSRTGYHKQAPHAGAVMSSSVLAVMLLAAVVAASAAPAPAPAMPVPAAARAPGPAAGANPGAPLSGEHAHGVGRHPACCCSALSWSGCSDAMLQKQQCLLHAGYRLSAGTRVCSCSHHARPCPLLTAAQRMPSYDSSLALGS